MGSITCHEMSVTSLKESVFKLQLQKRGRCGKGANIQISGVLSFMHLID
jgi:hypothetical protein